MPAESLGVSGVDAQALLRSAHRFVGALMKSIAVELRPKPRINPQLRLIIAKSIRVYPEQALRKILYFNDPPIGSCQLDRPLEVFGSNRVRNTQGKIIVGRHRPISPEVHFRQIRQIFEPLNHIG